MIRHICHFSHLCVLFPCIIFYIKLSHVCVLYDLMGSRPISSSHSYTSIRTSSFWWKIPTKKLLLYVYCITVCILYNYIYYTLYILYCISICMVAKHLSALEQKTFKKTPTAIHLSAHHHFNGKFPHGTLTQIYGAASRGPLRRESSDIWSHLINVSGIL